MQKIVVAILTALCFCMMLAGCSNTNTYQDGTYRAEFANYDSRGYKDFLEVTVEDSMVTAITYDAILEDGTLKSIDKKYETDMMAVQETYPARYQQDLVNQYLETQDIAQVDTIAGATYSSESFAALFSALQENMASGDTAPLVIENIAEK
ncbi:FMN-binding protein [Ruminococcaceae bacterium OttesenSCG-928-I18]|nr:FMN-binding protein [Ruminococcaceae bacterium OttesenSCG-928-I18]